MNMLMNMPEPEDSDLVAAIDEYRRQNEYLENERIRVGRELTAKIGDMYESPRPPEQLAWMYYHCGNGMLRFQIGQYLQDLGYKFVAYKGWIK